MFYLTMCFIAFFDIKMKYRVEKIQQHFQKIFWKMCQMFTSEFVNVYADKIMWKQVSEFVFCNLEHSCLMFAEVSFAKIFSMTLVGCQ